MKYKCEKCGEEHEEWPAITFKTPFNYQILSEDDKNDNAEISSDFCIIRDSEQTDRFIRAVLFQKVNDSCQTLDYGVWVSLSENNFKEYRDNFQDNIEAVYFGWLCSNILEYDSTLSLKTNVIVLNGNNRPEVVLQECDHPFYKDYVDGISLREALKRIDKAIKEADNK